MGSGLSGLVRSIRNRVDGLRNRGKKEERTPEEGTKAIRLSEEARILLSSLCEALGPRPAASVSSRRAARHIAAEMEKRVSDVTLTGGRIYPESGKGMLLFSYIFLLVSFILTLIGLPYLAVAAIALYLAALYGEIAGNGGWLRRFMRTSEATSVHAVIEPEEDVKQTLVFSSHHDSAKIEEKKDGLFWKMASWRLLQPAAFAVMSAAAVLSFLFEIFGGVFWRVNLPSVPVLLLLLLSLAASSLSFSTFRFSGEEYSPGAGDNLSGVAVAITLLDHFSREKKEGRGLRNTRLVFVSFDGEECGRSGSRLWFRDNAYLLENAAVLNFDGLYREDDLVFLSRDGNGVVLLSEALASRCSAIALAMGYRIPVGRIGLLGGETDAASAAGYAEAVTLTAMAPGTETPAHTADDTPDKVSEEALSRAIAVAVRLACDMDGVPESKGDDIPLLSSERKYRLSKY